MKDKILAALKTKYSNMGFSDKAFSGVAEYMATTITEEDKIDNGIAGVENLLKAFQSESDKLRGENAKLKSQMEKKDEPAADPKADPKKETKADEMPEWFKPFHQEFTEMKATKAADTRRGLLEKELAKTTESFRARILKDFGRMSFKDDDDFNAYLEETKQDAAANEQEVTNNGLKNHPKPASGSKNTKDAASKEEVDAVVKEIM